MDRTQVSATLRRARAAREATFLDECTIGRPADTAATIDRDTATMTTTAPTAVYSGPCSIRADESSSTPERTDTALTVRRHQLKVPMDAGPFRLGDVATLTATVGDASRWALDRQFRVVALPAGTFLTDQRLTVEEVVADG